MAFSAVNSMLKTDWVPSELYTVPQAITPSCEVFLSNYCIKQSVIPSSQAGRNETSPTSNGERGKWNAPKSLKKNFLNRTQGF
jgi:hypothetical protein